MRISWRQLAWLLFLSQALCGNSESSNANGGCRNIWDQEAGAEAAATGKSTSLLDILRAEKKPQTKKKRQSLSVGSLFDDVEEEEGEEASKSDPAIREISAALQTEHLLPSRRAPQVQADIAEHLLTHDAPMGRRISSLEESAATESEAIAEQALRLRSDTRRIFPPLEIDEDCSPAGSSTLERRDSRKIATGIAPGSAIEGRTGDRLEGEITHLTPQSEAPAVIVIHESSPATTTTKEDSRPPPLRLPVQPAQPAPGSRFPPLDIGDETARITEQSSSRTQSVTGRNSLLQRLNKVVTQKFGNNPVLNDALQQTIRQAISVPANGQVLTGSLTLEPQLVPQTIQPNSEQASSVMTEILSGLDGDEQRLLYRLRTEGNFNPAIRQSILTQLRAVRSLKRKIILEHLPSNHPMKRAVMLEDSVHEAMRAGHMTMHPVISAALMHGEGRVNGPMGPIRPSMMPTVNAGMMRPKMIPMGLRSFTPQTNSPRWNGEERRGELSVHIARPYPPIERDLHHDSSRHLSKTESQEDDCDGKKTKKPDPCKEIEEHDTPCDDVDGKEKAKEKSDPCDKNEHPRASEPLEERDIPKILEKKEIETSPCAEVKAKIIDGEPLPRPCDDPDEKEPLPAPSKPSIVIPPNQSPSVPSIPEEAALLVGESTKEKEKEKLEHEGKDVIEKPREGEKEESSEDEKEEPHEGEKKDPCKEKKGPREEEEDPCKEKKDPCEEKQKKEQDHPCEEEEELKTKDKDPEPCDDEKKKTDKRSTAPCDEASKSERREHEIKTVNSEEVERLLHLLRSTTSEIPLADRTIGESEGILEPLSPLEHPTSEERLRDTISRLVPKTSQISASVSSDDATKIPKTTADEYVSRTLYPAIREEEEEERSPDSIAAMQRLHQSVSDTVNDAFKRYL